MPGPCPQRHTPALLFGEPGEKGVPLLPSAVWRARQRPGPVGGGEGMPLYGATLHEKSTEPVPFSGTIFVEPEVVASLSHAAKMVPVPIFQHMASQLLQLQFDVNTRTWPRNLP